MNKTGQLIRARREHLGMTAVDVANKIGVHKSVATRVETGSRRMTMAPVLAVMRALDMPLEDQRAAIVAWVWSDYCPAGWEFPQRAAALLEWARVSDVPADEWGALIRAATVPPDVVQP